VLGRVHTGQRKQSIKVVQKDRAVLGGPVFLMPSKGLRRFSVLGVAEPQ
jgi:hypothetical protein